MAGPTRKTIGSYAVERELGQGGMGVVYLARQPALEREVVIKTLRRGLADDASIEERFRREAQAAARIHHQNVVAVHDCFAWRGEHFIVQEYVAGEDLASVLQVVRRLDPRIAGLVALELSRGLEEVHTQDVVHRDLKPGNVLLGRGGDAKIADFGIALEPRNTSLTQVGLAVGTPAYMSPEQHMGERADQRSDLFSFGVLLFEMLTGELPFPESDDEKVQVLVRRMEAGRYVRPRKLAPETPRALERLIRACLRPLPAGRERDRVRPPSAGGEGPERPAAPRGRLRGVRGGARRNRRHPPRSASSGPPTPVDGAGGCAGALRGSSPNRGPRRRRSALSDAPVRSGRARAGSPPRGLPAPGARKRRAPDRSRSGRGADRRPRLRNAGRVPLTPARRAANDAPRIRAPRDSLYVP